MINFMDMAEDHSESSQGHPSAPSSPKPVKKPPKKFQKSKITKPANKTQRPKNTQKGTPQGRKNLKNPSKKSRRSKIFIDEAVNHFNGEDIKMTYKTAEDLKEKLDAEHEQKIIKKQEKEAEEVEKMKFRGERLSPIKNKKNNKYFNKNRRKKKGKGKKDTTKVSADDHLTKLQKFNKKGNFQRQNLKKGYQERYTGMTHIYKTRYLPNGRSKAFYRKLDDKQESISAEPTTAKEVEEEFLYKSKQAMDITKMVEISSSSTIITKENVFFKMVNKGMMLFMLSRNNVPANLRDEFDQKIETLKQQGLGPDSEDGQSWKSALQRVFGHEDFYPFQRTVLQSSFEGHSSLVDFYTGAGKSLIFQFFSMLKPGLTIVIVPLISLMIDQIKKIPEEIPAICYNSWIPFTHRPRVFNLIRDGKVKILFVSPELFVSDIAWRLVIFGTRINLICIDEAHCVSESSHSFRHSYAFLREYVNMLKKRSEIYLGDDLFEVKEVEEKKVKKTKKRRKGKKEEKQAEEKEVKEDGQEKAEEQQEEVDTDPTNPGIITNKEEQISSGQMQVEGEPKQEEQEGQQEAIEADLENKSTHQAPKTPIVDEEFPILALTATSSAASRKDIVKYFHLSLNNVKFSNYYLRDNLRITVSLERQRVKNLHLLFQLRSFRRMKPLLVYCNFKRVTEAVAVSLKQNGINSYCFNSNLSELERLNILQQFLKTDPEQQKKLQNPEDKKSLDLGLYVKIDAIVTTVSLAMGIDHRSIRGIIHYNMPNSLETYVQEVGRAGRDGKPAHCHLFLNEDDYYFQRARAFTDFFVDRELIKSVVSMVLGLRSILQSLQSGEASHQYSYIKVPTIRSRFKITKKEFLNIMKHIKAYMKAHKVNWEYTETMRVRGLMKKLKTTDNKKYDSHPLIQKLIEMSQRVKRVHAFDVVEAANQLKINPFLFNSRMKDLSNELKFSYITDQPAYLFSKPIAPKDMDLKKQLNTKIITDYILKRNGEMIRTHAARVDALYMVLRDHAKKGIDKFIDDDLRADKNLKMEKYFKIYFSQGPFVMLEMLKQDGGSVLPILKVRNVKGCYEFVELKNKLSEFFAENRRFVRYEMTDNKGYGKVFRDFLKMIKGQVSNTFKIKEWNKNQYWGYFGHYDLTEVAHEIEDIFKMFYEEMKDEMRKSGKNLKKFKGNEPEENVDSNTIKKAGESKKNVTVTP